MNARIASINDDFPAAEFDWTGRRGGRRSSGTSPRGTRRACSSARPRGRPDRSPRRFDRGCAGRAVGRMPPPSPPQDLHVPRRKGPSPRARRYSWVSPRARGGDRPRSFFTTSGGTPRKTRGGLRREVLSRAGLHPVEGVGEIPLARVRTRSVTSIRPSDAFRQKVEHAVDAIADRDHPRPRARDGPALRGRRFRRVPEWKARRLKGGSGAGEGGAAAL